MEFSSMLIQSVNELRLQRTSFVGVSYITCWSYFILRPALFGADGLVSKKFYELFGLSSGCCILDLFCQQHQHR